MSDWFETITNPLVQSWIKAIEPAVKSVNEVTDTHRKVLSSIVEDALSQTLETTKQIEAMRARNDIPYRQFRQAQAPTETLIIINIMEK